MSRPNTPPRPQRTVRIAAPGAAALAACVLLGACATAPSQQPGGRAAARVDVPAEPTSSRATPTATAAHRAASLALELVGTPYRYGGADPEAGFDCSGLVFYSYTKNGVAVPRTSQQLFKASRKIALADAARGDLVFFQDQEKLSHVGIYVGDGRFVHAPSSGRNVSVADIEAEYYQRHLVAVGRIVAN